jgi:hypothetical protein
MSKLMLRKDYATEGRASVERSPGKSCIMVVIIQSSSLWSYQENGDKENGSIQNEDKTCKRKYVISSLRHDNFDYPQEKERVMNPKVNSTQTRTTM